MGIIGVDGHDWSAGSVAVNSTRFNLHITDSGY